MAAAGTCVGSFDNNRLWSVVIAGVTVDSTSQVFTLKESVYTSFGVFGTFGGTSLQWQGSNDGGTNWDNIGIAITSAGGGTLTPGQVFYGLYQLVATGGGATTSISAYIKALPAI